MCLTALIIAKQAYNYFHRVVQCCFALALFFCLSHNMESYLTPLYDQWMIVLEGRSGVMLELGSGKRARGEITSIL